MPFLGNIAARVIGPLYIIAFGEGLTRPARWAVILEGRRLSGAVGDRGRPRNARVDDIGFGFRPRSRHRGRLRRTARRIAVIIGGAINDHLVDAIARVIADLLFAGIAGGWRSDLRHLAINRADRRRVVILIGDDFYNRGRSEEHTSELQSLMRISYAVFCLKKQT